MSPTVLYDASKLHPDDLTGILTSETRMCGIVNNYPVGRRVVPYEEIQLYASDNRTLRVFVKTPNLDIVDLTGAVGVLSVRTEKGAVATVVVKHTNVPAEGQIGAANEGEMFFYLVPADTSALDIRQYVFDVRVTLLTGKVYTVLDGTIDLQKPVG